MEEAVAKAKDALAYMKPAPSLIKPMQDSVNTSVAVAANIQSLASTWGPLLEKVKLFTEFVDGIARVSGRTDKSSAVSDSRAIEYPGPPIR